MAEVSTAQITEPDIRSNNHHAKLDLNDSNMHLPIGYRSALSGQFLMRGENGDFSWEYAGLLPAALDYVDSSSAAPTTTANDIYLLDDSVEVLTVSDIQHDTGNTVTISFSGSPDLSVYSTVNNLIYVYGSGITNPEHIGRFVPSAIDNVAKTVDITNELITDNTLDETGLSSASAELPHSDWNGASNGDYVKYDATESLFFRIVPVVGLKCYDKTLQQARTFNGSKWLGEKREVMLALGDEDTPITTGSDKVKLRIPGDFYITDVRASLSTAGSTSGTTTIDINESGTSILSTKLTIDFGEKSSETAATSAVISDNLISDFNEISFDVDAVTGGADEAGLKVYLIGFYI